MKRAILLIIAVVVVFSFLAVSCKKKDDSKEVEAKKIKIITTIFPLYDFAKNIGGQNVEVSLLLPPGVESHGFEPKPADIVEINRADIFIYTGRYMELWAEDILRGVDNKNLIVIDTSKGITLIRERDEHGHHHHKHEEAFDPHIWLDFDNAQTMVDNILEGIVKADMTNKDTYIKNAAGYKTKLSELDKKFSVGLSNCKTNVFIHGGHFAFGYLATRYNLQYLSAYKGFQPDEEPTPKRLMELIKKMKKHNLRYVFYEELVSPRVSETIAKETGATLLKLHGAHNLTKDEWDRGITFISLMEQNLNNLKIGLQCE